MPTRSKTFRIFVSSTFADMKAERNALQEHVFPKLQKLCEAHGCRFQAVDLRWGVSEEAALDQQAMNICLTELKRCRQVSPRPNFIILFGDRYGWMPLPPQIEATEFDSIHAEVTDPKAQKRLDDWYRLDTNAVPPEYGLRARREEVSGEADYEAWGSTERTLHGVLLEAINRLGWAQGDKRREKYECSATHQEIINGALDLPDEREHVFAFLRTIENIDALPSDSEFIDHTDDGVDKARALKETVKGIKGVTSFDYDVTWKGSEPSSNLRKFAADALKSLKRIIREELRDLEQVDDLTREDIAHEEFGVERCRHFIGRQEILKSIAAYLKDDRRSPLVVYGRSGSGKSALMAKGVFDAFNAAPKDHIVQRYIGATPESTDIRTLLLNLCREITQVYQGDPATIPTDYKDLMEEFPKRLALAIGREPFVLFIDALDQLSPSDNAHALNWLPLVLPDNVKLVVSVLERDDEAGECYRSAKARVTEGALLRLGDMPPEEGEQILRKWLLEAYPGDQRALTDRQMESVLGGFSGCPLPLYLKLAFEEARRWRSYDTPRVLAGDVSGIVEDMLDRVKDKREHGDVLVTTFLGLLSASRHGLSESEIHELLSTDEKVMADLKGRSSRSPDTKSIPAVVWLRLYHDLEPYLLERSADATTLYNFYHRQVDETVMAAHLKPEYHVQLADYFDHLAVGLRRTNELPWQLAEAGRWQRLCDLLTDPDFFMRAWEISRFDVKTYWAQIEAASDIRMAETYRNQVERPESEGDKAYLMRLDHLLADTGHPDESLAIRLALVEHYRATGNLDHLSICLGNLAVILGARGELDGAMALQKETEWICRQLGNLDGLQRTLGNQAMILQIRGDLDGAMALHKEQERLCRQLGDLDGLGSCLGSQALTFKIRGELDEAMALQKENEQLCRQLGDLDSLSISLGHQGEILRARGDLDGATALQKETERICRQLGDLDGLGSCLGSQAVILKTRGDLDGAMALHKEQERLCRQVGNLDGLSISLGNQGEILRDRGDLDGAMALQKEKEQICRQLGNLNSLSVSLGNQAGILQARGNFDGAMVLHKEEELICRQLGNPDGLQRTFGNQALILIARGDLEAAVVLLKEQERICWQLGKLDGLSNSLGNQGEILRVQGDLEGALALQKDSERICRRLGDAAQGVAFALSNQASVLWQMGRSREGLPLAEEARRLAVQHGYTAMVERIDLVLNLVRQAALTEVAGSRKEFREYGQNVKASGGKSTESHERGSPNYGPLAQSKYEDDAINEARRNIEYQQKLAAWKALPWHRRLTTAKPSPPED